MYFCVIFITSVVYRVVYTESIFKLVLDKANRPMIVKYDVICTFFMSGFIPRYVKKADQ